MVDVDLQHFLSCVCVCHTRSNSSTHTHSHPYSHAPPHPHADSPTQIIYASKRTLTLSHIRHNIITRDNIPLPPPPPPPPCAEAGVCATTETASERGGEGDGGLPPLGETKTVVTGGAARAVRGPLRSPTQMIVIRIGRGAGAGVSAGVFGWWDEWLVGGLIGD